MSGPDRTRALAPDLVWEEGRFREGRCVVLEAEGGRIRDVVPAAGVEGAVRLADRALLPGFVNAHSHAFQRLLRGRTQWRRTGEEGEDFWTWRELMYAAARRLSPEDLQDVARFCFVEMLRVGYTAVGEFHYLHNDPEGRPYADPNELASRVVEAARAAGIRIVLLRSAYAAGGPGEPLHPEQARFATPDLDGFLAATEALAGRFRDDPLVGTGVAPHSVRAVPRAWHGPIAAWAAERRLPRHVHLNEQPAEVEASLAAWGLRPVELLAEEDALAPGLTGIHLTHLSPTEIRLFAEGGGTACLCPTTERDLGDGIPPTSELSAAGVPLSLGSDSHTCLDPFEEMRLVEYNERLRKLARVVLATEVGEGRRTVASGLLASATRSGARALGLSAGEIRPGAAADLVAVDLRHPSIEGWGRETLAASLVFSAAPGVVTDVWVGGRRRVEHGRHPAEEEAAAAFRRVAASVVREG